MEINKNIMFEQFSCIQDFFRENAGSCADHDFLVFPGNNVKLSFSEILLHWENAAALLQREGVSAHDRIILSLGNCIEYAITLGAIILAGGVPVIVNPGTSSGQLVDLSKKSGTKFAIAEKNVNGLTLVKKSVFSPANLRNVNLSYSPISATHEDIAYIVFTSGTTGMMKGTKISHANMLNELESMIRAYRLTEEDTHLCILPLYHASALYRNFLIPFSLGSQTVVIEKFSPEIFWECIEKYNVTFVQVVPAIISLLCESPVQPNKKIKKTIRYIGTASAPCPPEMIDRFEARFDIPVIEGYGLTETTCGATLNPPDRTKRKVGSVGLPLDIAHIDIVDENGNILLPDTEGEIRISGPLVSPGYLNPEDQGKGKLVKETILTGDIGYRDRDGFIFITGRQNEIISRGGFKVSPIEVEKKLSQHAAVDLAIVFSVPNEILGEDIIAYVKPAADTAFSETDVRKFLKQNLPDYKIPTRFFAVPDFFKNITFKASRKLCREHYLQGSRKSKNDSSVLSQPVKNRAFLIGKTVYLRPITEADTQSSRYLDNIMTREYQHYTVSGRFPQSETTLRDYWNSVKLPDSMVFAICDMKTEEYVGNIALRIDWVTRNAEFGRMIFKEFQNSSYSIDALKLLMQYVFEDLKLHRMWGGGANPSSIPSLIKLGFTLEGRLRKHGFLGGEWRDLFQMGILEEEFFALKEGKTLPRQITFCSPEILQQVIKSVAKAFSLDPSRLSKDSGPDSIEGWDSLGIMVLWSYLEEDFEVHITANDMIWATSIENIAIMVEGKLNE